MLDRINFARGRIYPSFQVNASTLADVYKSERVNIRLQADGDVLLVHVLLEAVVEHLAGDVGQILEAGVARVHRDLPGELLRRIEIRTGDEGVQLMVEGEKTRFWIPENLAYRGRRAPYGVLVFDIELLKIQ